MTKQLTLEDLDLLEQLCIHEAREDFYAFRKFIHPKMKFGWFTKDISIHLQIFYHQLIAKERPKLAICAPPQHGKSSAVVDFVAWIAGKHPDTKTIYTSFSERLGVRANKALQRMMSSKRYKDIFPHMVIDVPGITCNNEFIEYQNNEGYFRNTTVRGSITGESLDCMPAGTMINTDKGLVDIKNLDIKGLTRYNILSLNLKTGLLSYETISNFKSIERHGLLRFSTESGRVFEATEDHRIYIEGLGYIKARSVSKGDFTLRLLQDRIHKDSCRSETLDCIRSKTELLLQRLPIKAQAYLHESCEDMQRLWNGTSKTNRCFVSKVFGESKSCSDNNGKSSESRKALSNLSKHICYKTCPILQSFLREYSPFNGHERFKEPKMEQWLKRSKIFRIFNESLQQNKAIDIEKRLKQLSNLFKIGFEIGGSSYRWLASKPCFNKFDNFMHVAPCGNSQTDEREWRTVADKIVDIQRIDGKTTVYDITVNNNHNFFANDILVHNCGIIDDPLKGREAANSETVRNAVWDWLTDDFLTRFSDEAAMLVIMTRWHIDDPLSRLSEQLGDELKVVNYEAIADKDEKHRKAGEPLFAELKSLTFLAGIKAIMATTSWLSLFQGNPSQQDGEIIHGYWFKYYSQLPLIEYRCIYADTAQKTKERNDYSVLECWGKGLDGRIYLIDLLRGKWEAPELEQRTIAFWNKHKALNRQETGQLRSLKIEDKASGTGLIQKIKSMVDPLIPVIAVQRTKDKYTRVSDIVGYIEAGYVYLPENAPWLSDFVSECESFTSDDGHLHDDQIDPMCDAINDMISSQNELGVWAAFGKR
jgi:predicted phage terminase large subunit-like protein